MHKGVPPVLPLTAMCAAALVGSLVVLLAVSCTPAPRFMSSRMESEGRKNSAPAVAQQSAEAAGLKQGPAGGQAQEAPDDSGPPPDAASAVAEIETVSSSFYQEGTAVYYGLQFHGRRTASGERCDLYKYTAAHRTLPFNTRVRVTNLDNNKYVVVRVNDRGPFSGGHIIDLTLVAAEAIGLGKQGVAHVKLEVEK